MIFFVLLIIVINQFQKRAPKFLPALLRSWEFLPAFLRSLEPYDKWIEKYLLCFKFCQKIIVRKSSLMEADKFEKKIERRLTIAVEVNYNYSLCGRIFILIV